MSERADLGDGEEATADDFFQDNDEVDIDLATSAKSEPVNSLNDSPVAHED